MQNKQSERHRVPAFWRTICFRWSEQPTFVALSYPHSAAGVWLRYSKISESLNRVTMIGNKYGMSGALPSIQDKWVQFEEEDDGVQDISEFRYYQKKISPPPRPQETAKTPKQISPSQKKHSLSKWQNVKTFLNTPVTLPMWQLLDRSPQMRIQIFRNSH